MQALATMKTIWAALSFSTLLFLVVGLKAAAVPDEPPPVIMLAAMAFASLGVVVVSQVLPKQTLVAALKAQKFQVVETPAAERMFNDSPERARRFAAPAEVRQRLIMCAQTPFILGLALSESIAIMGLMLLMLGFELQHAGGFFAVSWALLFSRFPKFESFQRVLEATYDADLGPS